MKLTLPSLRTLFTRKAILSPRGSRDVFRSRLLGTERLEARAMLAADALSAWQNPILAADVNADGHVTAMDALRLFNELNSSGPRALSGTPTITRFSFMAAGEQPANYFDVNGDGFLTASDALAVINKLNAAADEKVRIRLQVTDTSGNPVTSLAVGSQFQLRAFTQDIRATSPSLRGVFSAVVDVTYDPALVSVSGPITYGTNYPNSHRSDASITATPGELNEIGALSTGSDLGAGEVLLFVVPFTVNSSGPITFALNPGDEVGSEVLVLGEDLEVPPAEVEFVGANITVGAAPTAVDDSATVVEDSQNNTIDVLTNDTIDPAGQPPLMVVEVTQGAHGAVVIAGDGITVRYTPAANFFGEDTFTYTIEDGDGNRATASVAVTVTNLNDPPQANADVFTVNADQSTELDVLANDSIAPDADETLSISAVTATSNGGNLSIRADRQRIIYTPAPGFTGTDTFSYLVTDGSGLVDMATVTVTVTNGNPIANNDFATLAEDSQGNVIDVLANDQLAPGVEGELKITEATATNAGSTVTVAADGKTITYTPAPDFAGTELLTYRIVNGQGGEATGMVVVTVTNVNDPPIANDDAVTVTQNSTANTLNVLANDSTAPDTGEVLTITEVGQTSQGGTVTIAPSGTSILYTPATDFLGQDAFTYTVSDGHGATKTATVIVTVEVPPANEPPVANDDSFTVDEDAPATTFNVLANDTDADGDMLEITEVGDPAEGGMVTLAEDGKSLMYTPASNFHGTDTFTYTISDGQGGTDTAMVTVQVNSVNDPPPKADDAFTVAEDSGATKLDVLTNDLALTNPDGQETITITAVGAGSQGGTITIADDKLSVFYTPRVNFFGSETFTYTIQDQDGGSATATVTMTVTSVNDAPTLGADSFTVQRDSSSNVFNVLVNDTDIEGDALTITSIGQTNNGGTVSLGPNARSLNYTPAPGFSGTETFTYTVSDGNGGSATQTVTVTVQNFQPGSLSGFVYVDSNANSAKDNGEVPIAGVTIRLWGTDVSGRQVNLTTTTDAGGAYQFTGVMPGSYVLEEVQPTQFIDGVESLGSAGGTAGHDQFFLALGNGQNGSGYNFGELGLRPEFIGRPNFFVP